jgi:transcriptional regulator with XRE-family HTH domain
MIVGDRIRRMRRNAEMTLVDMSQSVSKPEGGHYSPGYFSRLERGWAVAPLYAYIAIADVLGVEPGRLLGPDDFQLDATEGEMTLLRYLRSVRIPPHEAIARVNLEHEAESEERTANARRIKRSSPPADLY